MTQHKQSTRTRHAPKRSVRGAGVRDWAGATTGSPWCSPRPMVVDAWPCAPTAPGSFRFPSCPYVCPRGSSVLLTILPLRRMYLAHFPNAQIPLIHTLLFINHSFSLSLDYTERGRGEECKDSMSGLRSKDSSAIFG